MNTDWQKMSDQLDVPTNLVHQALRRGQARANARRRHRYIGVLVAAALVLVAAVINPLTLQAGGVAPAIRQLLDQEGKKTHHFDPTMNEVFGDMADLSVYQPVRGNRTLVGAVTLSVRGVMAAPGMRALVIDYQGGQLDPAALRKQTITVTMNGIDRILDVSQNYGQIALGHYRQFLAFYTPTAEMPSDTIRIRIDRFNGQAKNVRLPALHIAAPTATHRPLALTATKAGVTGGVDAVDAGAQSFVLHYHTTFAQTNSRAKALRQAAWISEATVQRRGKTLGQLLLGTSGLRIGDTSRGATHTVNFQSVFATQYQKDGSDKALPLRDLPADATVLFRLELPSGSTHPEILGTFSLPVSQLLP
ncbi:hypothetical protein [Lacticaseibacillus mingshuiensis]|uniref:DUF4179 domain-containing protein n=1 Tax=Lacticaseibacillus mingshuiensis TaxID=2799574 RepID=A0ABW4CJX4_9LACO|nr:hypothetical protein [Lacticaseibacillus mingshuiensis]